MNRLPDDPVLAGPDVAACQIGAAPAGAVQSPEAPSM